MKRVRSPFVLGLGIGFAILAVVALLVYLLVDDGDLGGGDATAVATLTGATGQVVSDGICNANIPIEWVDSGNGRGATTADGRYMIFGGHVVTDASWQQARELALAEAEGQADAEITEGDDFVRIEFPGETRLLYRGRYEGVYCDFNVSATGRALNDEEKAGFEAAVASLGPA